jgi:hypothetical protein
MNTVELNQKQSLDAISLLDNIKLLRAFKGSSEEFVSSYLKDTALLCKSPIALYMRQENENKWVLGGQYGFSTEHKEALESCISIALPLSGRVIKNRFSYEKIDVEWLKLENPVGLAIKLDGLETDKYSSFIYIIIDQQSRQHISDTIIRVLMLSDIPNSYQTSINSNIVPTQNENNKLSTDILEVLSIVIGQEKFVLTSMSLVNEIATRFDCSQVSIGWARGEYIEPIAISHIEKFDKHTDHIYSLKSLYEESADQDEEIVYPEEILSDTIIFAHKNYLKLTNIKQVCSLPLRIDNRVVGVIVCERSSSIFRDDEIASLRLIANHTVNWLEQLNQYNRWWGGRVLQKAKKYLSKFLTPKHTLLKFLSILFSFLFIYSLLGTWEYKIEATGNLETDNLAFLSVPFNSFVYEVKVNEGDKVSKGDILLTLDQNELYLKESGILAEIYKYKSESEKRRATRELADMRIALAKKEQSEASLQRIRYHIDKSVIKAPINGIIVQGDKEDLLGSPVTKGDILFKIANPTELYLKLKIKESDIDEIKVGQGGLFSLLSSPDIFYKFKIEKIIPMAEVDKKDGNIFVVKAVIKTDALEWWRPGMSSVAKVEVGQRNILWILTHDFTEFLRLYFWI